MQTHFVAVALLLPYFEEQQNVDDIMIVHYRKNNTILCGILPPKQKLKQTQF